MSLVPQLGAVSVGVVGDAVMCDLYVKAFADKFGADAIAVVGRSSEDCQRVLTSLSVAGRTLLWALQGHLSLRCGEPAFHSEERLANELVIDHAEYRRVTHREPHFRRAFAEVFSVWV